jgi:hypothetical protein
LERVIVYIDGFNLYFGLKTKGWRRYYWLDVELLAKNLLKDDQNLIKVNYFTSRISMPPDKKKRQATYLEALQTLSNTEIFYGHYLTNTIECKRCGNIFPRPNEKMTDVNIAIEMLTDAFQDKFDKAILISADSDLSGPLKKIKQLFTNKKVLVAFPPERYSFELEKIAHSSFTIGRKKFAGSVFPDEITKPDGFVLQRPDHWKL